MMPTQGMGIYNVIGVLGIILSLAKEIFIVVLLFQLIRIATMYIKKHKDGGSPPSGGEISEEFELDLEQSNEEDHINNTKE